MKPLTLMVIFAKRSVEKCLELLPAWQLCYKPELLAALARESGQTFLRIVRKADLDQQRTADEVDAPAVRNALIASGERNALADTGA